MGKTKMPILTGGGGGTEIKNGQIIEGYALDGEIDAGMFVEKKDKEGIVIYPPSWSSYDEWKNSLYFMLTSSIGVVLWSSSYSYSTPYLYMCAFRIENSSVTYGTTLTVASGAYSIASIWNDAKPQDANKLLCVYELGTCESTPGDKTSIYAIAASVDSSLNITIGTKLTLGTSYGSAGPQLLYNSHVENFVTYAYSDSSSKYYICAKQLILNNLELSVGTSGTSSAVSFSNYVYASNYTANWLGQKCIAELTTDNYTLVVQTSAYNAYCTDTNTITISTDGTFSFTTKIKHLYEAESNRAWGGIANNGQAPYVYNSNAYIPYADYLVVYSSSSINCYTLSTPIYWLGNLFGTLCCAINEGESVYSSYTTLKKCTFTTDGQGVVIGDTITEKWPVMRFMASMNARWNTNYCRAYITYDGVLAVSGADDVYIGNPFLSTYQLPSSSSSIAGVTQEKITATKPGDIVILKEGN